MKKLSLILLSLIFPFLLMAQEKTKQKEVGLLFSNLDNFGLTFKTGTNKSLWRFNTLYLSGNNNNQIADSIETNSNSFGFNVQFGKEFRTTIAQNLEFRYGADLSFRFNHSESDRNDKTIDDSDRYFRRDYYEPGINLVIGLNYVINDHLVFGAEILPFVSYITGKEKIEGDYYYGDKETDISGFRFGLSNTSARLSLVYRF